MLREALRGAATLRELLDLPPDLLLDIVCRAHPSHSSTAAGPQRSIRTGGVGCVWGWLSKGSRRLARGRPDARARELCSRARRPPLPAHVPRAVRRQRPCARSRPARARPTPRAHTIKALERRGAAAPAARHRRRRRNPSRRRTAPCARARSRARVRSRGLPRRDFFAADSPLAPHHPGPRPAAWPRMGGDGHRPHGVALRCPHQGPEEVDAHAMPAALGLAEARPPRIAPPYTNRAACRTACRVRASASQTPSSRAMSLSSSSVAASNVPSAGAVWATCSRARPAPGRLGGTVQYLDQHIGAKCSDLVTNLSTIWLRFWRWGRFRGSQAHGSSRPPKSTPRWKSEIETWTRAQLRSPSAPRRCMPMAAPHLPFRPLGCQAPASAPTDP